MVSRVLSISPDPVVWGGRWKRSGLTQRSFILAYASADQRGVGWAWLPVQGWAQVCSLWSVPCTVLVRPSWGAAAVGRSSQGDDRGVEGECYGANLVHKFSCTGSGCIPFTKRSHMDQPKVKEQRGMLLAWRWRKRERICLSHLNTTAYEWKEWISWSSFQFAKASTHIIPFSPYMSPVRYL